jgi:hypothetical protein
MKLLDPGLIAGVLGLLIGLICLCALGKKSATFRRTQQELETNQAACLEQIGQVSRTVEFLELSGRNTDDAIGRAMNRSLRSQAMHLLRTGLSPETVASTLGVAIREVRLIAGVSSILARNE